MTFVHHVLAFLLLSSIGLRCAQGAQWASTSLATIPLALRTPYLNVWAGASIANDWSRIWTGGHIVGWCGAVRVDGVSYRWLGGGCVSNNLTQTVSGSVQMSPTQTTLKATAGPVQLTITFLSPIEPNDLVKQSFPFSYTSVDVSSTDGQEHSVQLYSDFTGEILSDDLSVEITSSTTQTSNSIIHTFARSSPSSFLESGNQPEDGTAYFGMASSQPGASWQVGNCDDMRGAFAANASLTNKADQTNTRKINDGTFWFCLGLAMDFGDIKSSTSPAVWGLGLVRDPAIRASTGTGTQTRSPYFMTKYSTVNDAVDDFLADYASASNRASSLDAKIMGDGATVSSAYADLLAFAARPAFGAMDITVARTSPTTLDASDIQIFMKDVGRTTQTNAVDTLFSAFPAFLYLNSTLAGLLLEPLFNFESTQIYQNKYAAPNLGSSYPDVRGNISSTSLSLEASGSMLIMALAYAKKSGDGTQCQRHYNLLKTWADYLAANTSTNSSSTFLTADLGVPTGDTNLALKSIIGLQAMSAINKFLEPQGASSADTSSYTTKAQNLMQNWKKSAFANGFVKATFDDDASWSLMYNAYADRLLKTSLISDDIYNAQASFYASQTSSAPSFGFPYDSRLIQARSDLSLLTASSLSDTTVRDALISAVHKRAVLTTSNVGWATSYYANNGTVINGISSPAHGATFSLLALNLPDQTIKLDLSLKVSTDGSTTITKKSNVAGPVAGGVVGGLVFLALVAGGIFWYRRRQQKRERSHAFDVDEPKEAEYAEPFNPYHDFEHLSTQAQTSNTTLLASGGPVVVGKNMIPLRPNTRYMDSTPLSPGGYSGSGSGSGSVAPSMSPPSSEGTFALRNEVEELRREMAAIRQNQTVLTEAPPMYSDPNHI